jgi:hypothetical protein
MTQKDNKNSQSSTQKPSRPNDTGSVHVEGFVKIFDPKTQETFVEKRA